MKAKVYFRRSESRPCAGFVADDDDVDSMVAWNSEYARCAIVELPDVDGFVWTASEALKHVRLDQERNEIVVDPPEVSIDAD